MNLETGVKLVQKYECRSCQYIDDIYSYETRELDRKEKRSKDSPGHSNVQRLEWGKASERGHEREAGRKGGKPGECGVLVIN